MKVMVIGATTPLGAAIVDHLLARRDTDLVLAVGRERESHEPARDRLVYRAADLTHARAVHDLVWSAAREHAIDVVVHVAQHRDTRAVGSSIRAQNVTAATELVRACREHRTIRRLVYRSFADVYAVRSDTAELVNEDAPLDFDPHAPAWLRNRVEADLAVCSQRGGPLAIAVLRCAEIFAADSGSSLWNALSARVCLRPLGFDPMVNLLSIADAASAFGAALASDATGVFNIPGADTLPLSRTFEESVRVAIPVPRAAIPRARRLRAPALLDGSRARRELGYAPHTAIAWPMPWWRQLLDQLGAMR
ncbi:MAG TPA: NAD-dependent epimerase/dehydratase family protein [Kofleriaceae bacterium]|nr:NAD-dependent epimerase/dehydratase family protein [Kofleriaceae bacterium]